MTNTCAVTQDLNRYQGEIDAEAAREVWADNEWPELKKQLAAQLEKQQPVRITDHRGTRTLVSWTDITYDAACRHKFAEAIATSLTDATEGGMEMREAVQAEISEKLEQHKSDLLDELRREQGEWAA